jgi:hypothetical protein
MSKIHHGVNVYDGFDASKYPEDLSGGDTYPIIAQIVNGLKPKLAIEVGSWKGKSAVHLADLMSAQHLDVAVVCVDTWLGSDPVHTWRFRDDPVWGMGSRFKFGYPTLYEQFLANVCHAGLENVIVPFPNTSHVAAGWFKEVGLLADYIYVDGCHDEDFVYLDLVDYWPLLKPAGVMIGDDYSAMWSGVICGVNRFAREYKLTVFQAEGDKWILQKEKA